MTSLREHDSYSPLQSQEIGPRPKVYFGSYMPFAGVKIYTLLDEYDVAEGKNKIGPVGWRLPKQRVDDAIRTPERELVLA